MLSWDEVQGLIRHGLTSGAGALVAHGIIGSSDVEPVIGAVMGLLAILWSIASKRMAKA